MNILLLAVSIALLVALHRQLHGLRADVRRLSRKEHQIMDELQDVMEVVAAQTTLVGSVVEFINGLPDNSVDPVAKQAIIDALKANSVALETAIGTNIV